GRTRLDWLIALAATAVFGGFAAVAHVPEMALAWRWVAGLVCAMLVLLVGTGLVPWRATRFNRPQIARPFSHDQTNSCLRLRRGRPPAGPHRPPRPAAPLHPPPADERPVPPPRRGPAPH